MRMKELEQISNIPRTTIHFYLREKLLPPPKKSATNTGEYSQSHLDRLLLIHRLRSAEGGQLPLYLVRRILEMVDQGVDPEIAITLEQAVLGGNYSDQKSGPFSLEELAEASGIDQKTLEKFVNYGLLLPIPDAKSKVFDALDLILAKTYHEILPMMDWNPEDFSFISEKIREISDYEWTLRNRTVKNKEIAESVMLRSKMQQFANLMHRYLFYRARLYNIDEELQKKSSE